jgi:hypothetical protein
MPMTQKAKLAIALGGVAALVGAIGAATVYSPNTRTRRKSSKSKSESNPASISVGGEDTGFALATSSVPSLSAQSMNRVILDSRRMVDPGRSSFSEYWRTLASRIYPQVAEMSSEDWSSWSTGEEASLIRQDAEEYLKSNGVGTRGWRFALWLRFDCIIGGCYEALAPHTDEIAQCVASEIYPGSEWPADDASPQWQKDMWATLLEHVHAYVESR